MPNIEMTLIKVNEKDLNVQSIESVMKGELAIGNLYYLVVYHSYDKKIGW